LRVTVLAAMTNPELAAYLKRYLFEVGIGEIVVNIVAPVDSWVLRAVNPDDGMKLQREFFEQRMGILHARAKLVGNFRLVPLLDRGQALVTGSARDLYELVRPGGPIERDSRFAVPFEVRWHSGKIVRRDGQLSPRV
jgi:hypothetical protein